MYLLRLDDASEYMDIEKWRKMEALLDKYEVKPIFGIIPANKDPKLLEYGKVEGFWKMMHSWVDKGWTPALHGYTHVFETEEGGINPVNHKSEFAGVPLDKQCLKIREGKKILENNNIIPKIFFAPAHTFDLNTIKALKKESSISVISDTVANDTYYKYDFFFIPQQSGVCRKLPFKTVTFCYHPNTMNNSDFEKLEMFLNNENRRFTSFDEIKLKRRHLNIWDNFIRRLYFLRK